MLSPHTQNTGALSFLRSLREDGALSDAKQKRRLVLPYSDRAFM